MRPSGGRAGDPLSERLRLVAVAMAGSLSLLLALILTVVPVGDSAEAGSTLHLALAGAALGLIVVGLVLAVSATGAEPTPARSARILASLALREGGGLLGLPLASLGAGRAWAAALLGLAALSILALLPPRASAA